MKLSQFIHVNFIAILLFSCCANSAAVNEPVKETFENARKQFYAAIEDKKQMHAYDPKLIKNVVVFLIENTKLTNDEKTYLKRFLSPVGWVEKSYSHCEAN